MRVMKSVMLALVVSAVSVIQSASGFVINTCFSKQTNTVPLNPRYATVYFGDASSASLWDPHEEHSSYKDENTSDHYGLSSRFETLFRDKVASLARVAAAFAPPSQRLNIQDIEHVQVLGLDERHMDVEAVVCEDDGCVTLMVPIVFPTPCDDQEEECVMDNFDLLDHQAQDVLEKECNFEKEQEQVQSHSHLVTEQHSHEVVPLENLPLWWVPPPLDMADDCRDVVTLLNQDDFSADIRSLAARALKVDNTFIQEAIVLAVGPAGIFLRVQHNGGTVQGTGIPQGERQEEIAYCFQQPCHDGESLRATVVQVITQAVEQA